MIKNVLDRADSDIINETLHNLPIETVVPLLSAINSYLVTGIHSLNIDYLLELKKQ